MLKWILGLIVLVVLLGLGLGATQYLKNAQPKPQSGIVFENPYTKTKQKPTQEPTKEPEKPKSIFNLDNPISVALLGIDRRSRDETGYRSDIMIILTINPKSNTVVMTSLPRDLWMDHSRINALYVAEGWEGFQKAAEEITGVKVERYILTDFADFSWIIDAMGGVNVDVQTSFTDTEFPVDATKGYQTVTFTQGPEKLTGERALIYARSRHGNNGEASDWMRMRRQHKILKGMVEAIGNPTSLFNPMNVEKSFNMVTTGKMDTNLTIPDAYFLWDLYKDKSKYKFISLFLDSNYVFNPPMSEYGGAWVLRPIGNDFSKFHADYAKAIEGTDPTVQVNLDNAANTSVPVISQ